MWVGCVDQEQWDPREECPLPTEKARRGFLEEAATQLCFKRQETVPQAGEEGRRCPESGVKLQTVGSYIECRY